MGSGAASLGTTHATAAVHLAIHYCEQQETRKGVRREHPETEREQRRKNIEKDQLDIGEHNEDIITCITEILEEKRKREWSRRNA